MSIAVRSEVVSGGEWGGDGGGGMITPGRANRFTWSRSRKSKLVCCRCCWPNFVQLFFDIFTTIFVTVLSAPRRFFAQKTKTNLRKKNEPYEKQKSCLSKKCSRSFHSSTLQILYLNPNPYLHLRQERFALIATCWLFFHIFSLVWPFTWSPEDRVLRLVIEVIRNRHWNRLRQSDRVSQKIKRKKRWKIHKLNI